MLKAMYSNRLLAFVLLIVVSGIALAETVNINPHKIVLNAQGASDDVQANVHIVLPGSLVEDFDVTLALDGIKVAEAESAFYCVLDDILIVGFDRTDLQNNEDVQDMANTTVTATVTGWVLMAGEVEPKSFSGTDLVEIVAPGKNGK